MELNTIKELAKLLREQDLTALEFEDGASRVRLERGVSVQSASLEAQPPLMLLQNQAAMPSANVDPGMDFNEMKAVTSPLVGVFYSSGAPDQPPYVHVGDIVKKGDVLCIVEAMKVMNEITAEFAGQIVDICVQNEDVVEFGQTLFKLV